MISLKTVFRECSGSPTSFAGCPTGNGPEESWRLQTRECNWPSSAEGPELVSSRRTCRHLEVRSEVPGYRSEMIGGGCSIFPQDGGDELEK